MGVNHLEGHLHAAFLEDPDIALPAVVLLVSGGHTMLIHMREPGRYRLLGQTIDDAAGEAFDKVARFLGLGYPGGPAIEKAAAAGDPRAIPFPRGLRHEGYDFSFSGLKTAVITYVRKHPEAATADVAASFQEAVVDVLVEKTRRAAADVGARSVCIGGGVAANWTSAGPHRNAARADGRAAFIPEPGHVHRQRRHGRGHRLVPAAPRRAHAARGRRQPQPPAPAGGLNAPRDLR